MLTFEPGIAPLALRDRARKIDLSWAPVRTLHVAVALAAFAVLARILLVWRERGAVATFLVASAVAGVGTGSLWARRRVG